MKIFVSLIAVLFIFILPASSIALTICGSSPIFQSPSNDMPADDMLNFLFEIIFMCASMHGDIEDINTIGVMDFFETLAMGGSAAGYDFGCTGDGFADEQPGTGDAMEGMIYPNAQGTAPAPEPATMTLLGAGMLGLAFAARRKLRKKRMYVFNR